MSSNSIFAIMFRLSTSFHIIGTCCVQQPIVQLVLSHLASGDQEILLMQIELLKKCEKSQKKIVPIAMYLAKMPTLSQTHLYILYHGEPKIEIVWTSKSC